MKKLVIIILATVLALPLGAQTENTTTEQPQKKQTFREWMH